MHRECRSEIVHARLIDRTVIPRDSRQPAEFAERDYQCGFLEGFAVLADKEIRTLARHLDKAAFVPTQSGREIRPDGNLSDPAETAAANGDRAPVHVHVLAQETERLASTHSGRVKSQEEHAERSRIHPACPHVLPRRVLPGRRRLKKKPQLITGIDVRHESLCKRKRRVNARRHRRPIDQSARRPVFEKEFEKTEFCAPSAVRSLGAVQKIEDLCRRDRIERHVPDLLRKRSEDFGSFFENDTAGVLPVDVGLDGAVEGHRPGRLKAATLRSDRVSNFA